MPRRRRIAGAFRVQGLNCMFRSRDAASTMFRAAQETGVCQRARRNGEPVSLRRTANRMQRTVQAVLSAKTCARTPYRVAPMPEPNRKLPLPAGTHRPDATVFAGSFERKRKSEPRREPSPRSRFWTCRSFDASLERTPPRQQAGQDAACATAFPDSLPRQPLGAGQRPPPATASEQPPDQPAGVGPSASLLPSSPSPTPNASASPRVPSSEFRPAPSFGGTGGMRSMRCQHSKLADR